MVGVAAAADAPPPPDEVLRVPARAAVVAFVATAVVAAASVAGASVVAAVAAATDAAVGEAGARRQPAPGGLANRHHGHRARVTARAADGNGDGDSPERPCRLIAPEVTVLVLEMHGLTPLGSARGGLPWPECLGMSTSVVMKTQHLVSCCSIIRSIRPEHNEAPRRRRGASWRRGWDLNPRTTF